MPTLPRQQLDAIATELGFTRWGVTTTEYFTEAAERFKQWILQGHHADMDFMLQHSDRADPTALLEGALSMIVVAIPHPRPNAQNTQTIAAYAQGDDYHQVIKEKLRELAARIETRVPEARFRACVDTAPILEREAAARAGVAFIGKSCMAIVPGLGSYVLLGSLITTLALEPDPPARERCGSCKLCLIACPTGAFVGPRQLDAKRCISYLTIENQGPIPRDLRPLIGQHLFGCDICQSVCPFNASKQERAIEPRLKARASTQAITATQLLTLTASGYRKLVKGSALARANRAQLGRNAAVVLGNTRDPIFTDVLISALGSIYPLIRGHAAWALGQIQTPSALQALADAELHEEDHWVREELSCAQQKNTSKPLNRLP